LHHEFNEKTEVYSALYGYGTVVEVVSDTVVSVLFSDAGVNPIPVKISTLRPASSIKKPAGPIPAIPPSDSDNLIEPGTEVQPSAGFDLDRLHVELISQGKEERTEELREQLEMLMLDDNRHEEGDDDDEELNVLA
jgi:hypothetical protein